MNRFLDISAHWSKNITQLDNQFHYAISRLGGTLKKLLQMANIMTAKHSVVLALAIPIGILSTNAYADQWDGLFLGVNAGGAQMKSEYKTGPVNFLWNAAPIISPDMWNKGRQNHSKSGSIFGLSAAYNVQVNSLVYGGELGLNGADLKLDNTGTYKYTNQTHYYTYTQKAGIQNLLTLRGRAGYAFGHSLLSVTGGIAATSLKTGLNYSDDYSGPGKYTAAHTKTSVKVGWTAGIAYEHKLPDDMALKAEFTHVDFGTSGFTTPIWAGDGTYVGDMKLSSRVFMNIFSLGIEKKF